MAIKDLQPKQGNVTIEVEVSDVGNVREFQKFGKAGKVSTATVKDETGTMKLSLWNEQVDQVHAGDKIRITNGYCSEYQGELQLTTGRFGQLEVIGKADKKEQEATEDNFEEDKDFTVDEEKFE